MHALSNLINFSLFFPETHVFILVALARVNAGHWFINKHYNYNDIILNHEDKNTRFWATYSFAGKWIVIFNNDLSHLIIT